MAIRTDLACELLEGVGESAGVKSEKINFGRLCIERTQITDSEGEKRIGRPRGSYVTVGFSPLDIHRNSFGRDELLSAIRQELSLLLGNREKVLVVGLGNRNVTPDAFGPKTADRIFATRHIPNEVRSGLGLGSLCEVSVISPGVLGQTGLEAAEITAATVKKIRPEAVILLDALAAGSVSRVGSTVQLSDAGICPGSGVGNSRQEISRRTLSVPTVAVGVPTVVDAAGFAEGLLGREHPDKGIISMMVTPRDIDSLVVNLAKTVALAVNCALQPGLSTREIETLMNSQGI